MTDAFKEAAPEVATNEPPEEYATYTLRIDHLLTDDANEGQVVLTTIASTREVVDDLVSLMEYHGQAHFLGHKDIRALLAQVEGNKGAIVYVADPQRSYIVIDSALYDEVQAKDTPMGGSRLNADSSFLAVARDLMSKAPTTENGDARKFWAFVSN